MKIKRIVLGLLCASLIGISSEQILANPKISNQAKSKIIYNFDEYGFFQEGFKPQDTIEELIYYSYSKYNNLVKKVKSSYPEETLEDLVNNSRPMDWIRFWFLVNIDYAKNLNALGYNLENIITKGDNLKILLFDKKRAESKKTNSYLKFNLDINSMSNYIIVDEIKRFLEGNDFYMVKKDEKGNFIYSIIRCEK